MCIYGRKINYFVINYKKKYNTVLKMSFYRYIYYVLCTITIVYYYVIFSIIISRHSSDSIYKYKDYLINILVLYWLLYESITIFTTIHAYTIYYNIPNPKSGGRC